MKIRNATLYTRYYDGAYEKKIMANGTSTQYTYIPAGDGLAAVFMKTGTAAGTLNYIHTDHLGSIIALTNTSGTIAQEYAYDPWGRRRNPADWSFNNVPAPTLLARGFTGHEHIDELSLNNMNGRIYDPVLGMFISCDPYVQDPTKSQNFNRYSYAMGNPLKYTDPTGNESGDPYGIAAAIAAANAAAAQAMASAQAAMAAQAAAAAQSYSFSYAYSTNYNYSNGMYNANASYNVSLGYNYNYSTVKTSTETTYSMNYSMYFNQQIYANANYGENNIWSYSSNINSQSSTSLSYSVPNINGIIEQYNKIEGVKYIGYVGTVASVIDNLGLGSQFISEIYSGTASSARMVANLGKFSDVAGYAGPIAAGVGTIINYDAMTSGKISSELFSYRTVGTWAGVGVTYTVGAPEGFILGGSFIIGESVYDALVLFRDGMVQFTNDVHNAIGRGWMPGQ